MFPKKGAVETDMNRFILPDRHRRIHPPIHRSTAGIPSFNCLVLQSFENVFIEHIIYSAALAVIVGMIFSRSIGRDPSLIIIAIAFVPDIDFDLEIIQKWAWLDSPCRIHHGDLHNVLFLVVFSLLLAGVLRYFGIRFIDGLICSAIGIAVHFFEDILVLNPAYAFLWPYSTKIFGLGIMDKTRNLFGIANSTVLLAGIILLAGAVLLRTLIEGTDWWRVFLRGGREDIS
jgi:membrane-bound metal-dependent hydrolase YbcI (DUF457 family)